MQLVLFWIFFIFSLFPVGESPSLVKNVEVEFEIKPRHPISRGNMSVNQLFLTHYSHRSSYFSNFYWCAYSIYMEWVYNYTIANNIKMNNRMYDVIKELIITLCFYRHCCTLYKTFLTTKKLKMLDENIYTVGIR